MDVDEMPAGQAIDKLIAEKVLGLDVAETSGEIDTRYESKEFRPFIAPASSVGGYVRFNKRKDVIGDWARWSPSLGIGAAFEVLEVLRKKWGRVVLAWESDDGIHGAGWKVDINPGYSGRLEVKASPTPELAICRAALAAVEEA